MSVASPAKHTARGSIVVVGGAAWLAMVGFDFFLHGGLLAGMYATPGSFLLPLEDAFRLIPLGYASLALLAVLLVWLASRLAVRGWRGGAAFGLKLGALVWGAEVLGLLSISTASPTLMATWFIGQTAELGIAGAFVGAGLAGTRGRALFARVGVLAVVGLISGVVIQNLLKP